MALNDSDPTYREIIARFNFTATCGHQVRKNDRIGWRQADRATRCKDCQRKAKGAEQ